MPDARKLVELHWPMAGLDRGAAYRQQRPYSTPDCQNVRPLDPLEQRERGGSRPGLVRAYQDPLATTGVTDIRLLHEVSSVAAGNVVENFSSYTTGAAIGSPWSQGLTNTANAYATTVSDTSLGKVMGYLQSGAGTSTVGEAGIVREKPANCPADYTVRGTVYFQWTRVNWTDQLNTGDTRVAYIYATTRDETTELSPGQDRFGLWATLTFTYDGSDWALTGTMSHESTTLASLTTASYTPTAASGNRYFGWMKLQVLMTVDIGETSTVSLIVGPNLVLDAEEFTPSAYDGDFYGVGACDYYYPAGGPNRDRTYWDNVQLDYTATTGEIVQTKKLCAAANEVLYYESAPGVMTAATGTYTISTDRHVQCAERGQKLYIADDTLYEFDPSTGAVSALTASAGSLPTNCHICCRYRDRLVLAGDTSAPHVWYMSRSGDPTDWDYAADSGDVARAVAGTNADAGVVGEPITALVPFSDDYMVFGCVGSLWVLRGDPAAGGAIDCLSSNVGIVDKFAWTRGPAGELIFLSHDGVWAVPPGVGGLPVSISRERLPQELRRVNPGQYHVQLEYDSAARGVHIMLTPFDTGESVVHYWLDWTSKSFWPSTYQSDHEPTAMCGIVARGNDEATVIFGGRDGYLRKHSSGADTDDGSAITSYVMYGPLSLGGDYRDGIVQELTGVLDLGSNDVTWQLATGTTHEAAVTASAFASGTWTAGMNYTARPRARGRAATLKVTGTSSWAIEMVMATIRRKGKARKA